MTTRRKIRPDLSENGQAVDGFADNDPSENRHDKDRMIYLSKRKIEKEFHTPRFAKVDEGCGA